MKENKQKKASDDLSDATQEPLDSFGLIKIGDWIWGERGFGQVTQIFHDYYEEYDNDQPGDIVAGGYKDTWAILKYFCTSKKVRRNATGLTSIFLDMKPIVEGDERGFWNIIQKYIKENPEKYLAYQKYKPKTLYDHMHIGYFVGPRLGNPEHTKEFFIDLIAKIREDLPESFTFADLMKIAQKYQCPFRLDKPVPLRYRPNMYITLFYKIGEYQGKRKLFYCLDEYINFGNHFYEPPVVTEDEEIVMKYLKEYSTPNSN